MKGQHPFLPSFLVAAVVPFLRLLHLLQDLLLVLPYSVYQSFLERRSKNWNKPRHVGIIMDGNRRYARQQGYSKTSAGHEKGAEKLHEVFAFFFYCYWCFTFSSSCRFFHKVRI